MGKLENTYEQKKQSLVVSPSLLHFSFEHKQGGNRQDMHFNSLLTCRKIYSLMTILVVSCVLCIRPCPTPRIYFFLYASLHLPCAPGPQTNISKGHPQDHRQEQRLTERPSTLSAVTYCSSCWQDKLGWPAVLWLLFAWSFQTSLSCWGHFESPHSIFLEALSLWFPQPCKWPLALGRIWGGNLSPLLS